MSKSNLEIPIQLKRYAETKASKFTEEQLQSIEDLYLKYKSVYGEIKDDDFTLIVIKCFKRSKLDTFIYHLDMTLENELDRITGFISTKILDRDLENECDMILEDWGDIKRKAFHFGRINYICEKLGYNFESIWEELKKKKAE
jgi:hypothetical protein